MHMLCRERCSEHLLPVRPGERHGDGGGGGDGEGAGDQGPGPIGDRGHDRARDPEAASGAKAAARVHYVRSGTGR